MVTINFFIRTLSLCVALITIITLGAPNASQADALIPSEHKDEIEKIIHDYLLKNPEIRSNLLICQTWKKLGPILLCPQNSTIDEQDSMRQSQFLKNQVSKKPLPIHCV